MMGRDQESFRASAIDLVSRHAGEIKEDSISYAPSRNGNFLSITIVIEAKSQQQLDDLYTDLSNNDEILVAL